jgi:hypothetical protein
MPPTQQSIREVPDRAFVCRTARRRFKRQNHRNLVQLLLVTSELSAAAVAELADQELQRVRAARADNLAPAPDAPFTDLDRAGDGDPSPVCTQPAVAGDKTAPTPAAEPSRPPLELARKILQESREQSAAVRRLLSRSSEQAPRRPPTPSDPALVSVAGSSPAPGSRPEESLARVSTKLRSTVAELGDSHLAPGPRPRPPSPTGGVAAAAPRDLAGLLLPDGTSVAQALAARDARIAQLSFEISDRDRRQRFASIGRAAAFVRDPSNQLADPSPGQALPSLGRAPASPRGASSPALPRVLLPLQLPQVPRRARRPRPSGPRADPAQPAHAEPPSAALSSPLPPGP